MAHVIQNAIKVRERLVLRFDKKSNNDNSLSKYCSQDQMYFRPKRTKNRKRKKEGETKVKKKTKHKK